MAVVRRMSVGDQLIVGDDCLLTVIDQSCDMVTILVEQRKLDGTFVCQEFGLIPDFHDTENRVTLTRNLAFDVSCSDYRLSGVLIAIHTIRMRSGRSYEVSGDDARALLPVYHV